MSKKIVISLALGIAVVLLSLLDLCSGSTWLWPFGAADDMTRRIVWDLRLPRVLTAVVAGVALSESGLMMQTLFRNPLAGPYILGVSSGAGLGVAVLTMCTTLIGVHLAGSWGIASAAMAGSALVLLGVMAVAKKVKNNVSLLIVGMMIGSVAGALVNLIQNYANPDALKLFIVWTLGSLQGVGWHEMPVLLTCVGVGLVLVLFLIKPLNGLMLGEDYARALGVQVERSRIGIVIASGLLAGGVTAFCGPIAFVGVAVPHIARGIVGSADHRWTVPMSALVGAALVLACDMLCNVGLHPLPISTVSALFGAPIIVWIILHHKS